MSQKVFTIEFSDDVAREVERPARERGLTPSEFVAIATVEKVGEVETAAAYFADRARRAKPDAARTFFSRNGGEPPRPGDEIS